MRRVLSGFFVALLIAMTTLSAATSFAAPLAAAEPAFAQSTANNTASLASDLDRTQRVLNRFHGATIQLAACTNACRQNCAQVYSSCVGTGGRPGECASHRSRCLSSCGC